LLPGLGTIINQRAVAAVNAFDGATLISHMGTFGFFYFHPSYLNETSVSFKNSCVL
jgi:hypothetical protein